MKSLQGQDVILTARPGFDQRMGHQRQRPRFVTGLVDDGVHEAVFDMQAGSARRFDDGAAQLRIVHRPHQYLVVGDVFRQPGNLCALHVKVRAHGDDHAHLAVGRVGHGRDCVDELFPLFPGRQRKKLLELIDAQD